MGKPKPTLESLKAELQSQNETLAKLASSLDGRAGVIPPAFFEAFDEACAVRRAPSLGAFTFTFSLRV